MKIGILGSGTVAQTLGAGFLKHGHEVVLGSGSPEKLNEWVAKHPGTKATGFAQAAAFGEVVVLAVKGTAARAVLASAGEANLAGKAVLDTTNPISGAPVNGVLPYFTGPNDSLLEQLQREAPQAHFVKAFNSVGAGAMVNPKLAGGPPTMFIAGNDEAAKRRVAGLVDQLGWDVADLGGAEAARAIEPLCILWCLPGFRENSWGHAFKLLRG